MACRTGSRVCGSDGRTYGSECELLRHSCRRKLHLFITSYTPCRGMRRGRLPGGPFTSDVSLIFGSLFDRVPVVNSKYATFLDSLVYAMSKCTVCQI